MNSSLPFVPIIIVGAGRSGTNILRDTITSFDGFETWPCDEINPIWRHGNITWPNDEIPYSRATPAIKKFVRSQFLKIWKSSGKPQFIVEKTCANSLRVPFVDAILPEAIYIYIVRNGYDVVASAEKRWKGEFEFPLAPYLLSKARYTPLRDLPVYLYRFIKSRLTQKIQNTSHISSWGPRFAGMEDLSDIAVADLCALQWVACVESSDGAFSKLSDGKVVEVKYEELLSNPVDVIGDLLGKIAPDLIVPDPVIEASVAPIRPPSISKESAVVPLLGQAVQLKARSIMLAKGYEVGE